MPPPPPSVVTGGVFLCRPATPAAVTQDSSSARCRPTASVRKQWERERGRGWVRPSDGGTLGEREGRRVTHTHWHHRPQRFCLSSSQCKRVFNTKHYTAQKPWEIKWARMKRIRLFMLTCSLMPDNSERGVQRAATVPWSLTSHWRPWLKPLLHPTGLRPMAEECLYSRGAGPGKCTVSAGEMELQYGVAFNLFCSPSSVSVSHRRCEWVRRGPMWREGPLRKQLRLLHLSVPQRLQPGDHPEQEVLSRWDAAQEKPARDIIFPVDESGHSLMLAF